MSRSKYYLFYIIEILILSSESITIFAINQTVNDMSCQMYLVF